MKTKKVDNEPQKMDIKYHFFFKRGEAKEEGEDHSHLSYFIYTFSACHLRKLQLFDFSVRIPNQRN